jgi:hypothetical protein
MTKVNPALHTVNRAQSRLNDQGTQLPRRRHGRLRGALPSFEGFPRVKSSRTYRQSQTRPARQSPSAPVRRPGPRRLPPRSLAPANRITVDVHWQRPSPPPRDSHRPYTLGRRLCGGRERSPSRDNARWISTLEPRNTTTSSRPSSIRESGTMAQAAPTHGPFAALTNARPTTSRQVRRRSSRSCRRALADVR